MRSLLLTLILMFSMGCDYHISKLSDQKGNNDDFLEKVEDKQLNFEFIKTNILAPKCLGCHSPTSPRISLETYEDVIANLEDIVFDVEKDIMPPKKKGPLTTSEKEVLFRWVELGAPQ